MTDHERAAALADEIDAHGLSWVTHVFSEARVNPIGDDNEELIVAALRAYRPAPSDLRTHIAKAIYIGNGWDRRPDVPWEEASGSLRDQCLRQADDAIKAAWGGENGH